MDYKRIGGGGMKKCIKYKLIKTIKKIFKIKSPGVYYTSHYDDEEKGRKL